MFTDHTPNLTDALAALWPDVRRMRRNIAHVLQPGPDGWRKAAASSLRHNARNAARIASRLSRTPIPAAGIARLVGDPRAVQLGREVTRIRQIWIDEIGGDPIPDLDLILDSLRETVRRCRRGDA